MPETIQMSINSRMNQLWYTHTVQNSVTTENQQTTAIHKMNRSQKLMGEAS